MHILKNDEYHCLSLYKIVWLTLTSKSPTSPSMLEIEIFKNTCQSMRWKIAQYCFILHAFCLPASCQMFIGNLYFVFGEFCFFGGRKTFIIFVLIWKSVCLLKKIVFYEHCKNSPFKKCSLAFSYISFKIFMRSRFQFYPLWLLEFTSCLENSSTP